MILSISLSCTLPVKETISTLDLTSIKSKKKSSISEKLNSKLPKDKQNKKSLDQERT